MRQRLLVLSAILFLAAAGAQSAEVAVNPQFLEQYAVTGAFKLGEPTEFKFTRDGSVLFLRATARSTVQDLWQLDPKSGQDKVVVWAEKPLPGGQESPPPGEKARRERARISASGIAHYDLSADGRHILAPLAGRLYLLDRESGNVSELGSADH